MTHKFGIMTIKKQIIILLLFTLDLGLLGSILYSIATDSQKVKKETFDSKTLAVYQEKIKKSVYETIYCGNHFAITSYCFFKL